MGIDHQPLLIAEHKEVLVGALHGFRVALRYLPIDHLNEEQVRWLWQLQTVRGLMMYEPDVRPWFRRPDGSYLDAQTLDCGSYHAVIRNDDGDLIGCIRQTPNESVHGSQVLALLGDEAVEHILAYMGNPPLHAGMEGGRLAVHPAYRRRGIATLLIATGIAMARALDRSYIWGFVGTRARQHTIFDRFGYRDLDCALDWPHVGDVARLMWCNVIDTAYDSSSLVTVIDRWIDQACLRTVAS